MVLHQLLISTALLLAAGFMVSKFVNLADKGSPFATWLFFPIMLSGFFGVVGILDLCSSAFR